MLRHKPSRLEVFSKLVNGFRWCDRASEAPPPRAVSPSTSAVPLLASGQNPSSDLQPSALARHRPSPPPPRYVLSRSRLPGFPATRARLRRPNFRTDIRSRSRPRNTVAAGRDGVALISYFFRLRFFLRTRCTHANVDRRRSTTSVRSRDP